MKRTIALLAILMLAASGAWALSGGPITSAGRPPTVSQTDAENGTGTVVKSWTPERVKQAIDALGAAASSDPDSLDCDTVDDNLLDSACVASLLATYQGMNTYSCTTGAGCLDAKDGNSITVGEIAFVSKIVQADAGTTDGTTASKLVDAGQNFLTTVSVNDVVYNTTDGTYAYVTAVDDNDTLSLSADIIPTGKAYTVNSWWVLKYQATLSGKAESEPLVIAPDTNRNSNTWELWSWTKNGGMQFSALSPPHSDADPTAYQLRNDTTVTNHAHGALRWHDNTNIRQIVDMVAATAEGCTDDQVVAYDADNDLFYCKADADTGGVTAFWSASFPLLKCDLGRGNRNRISAHIGPVMGDVGRCSRASRATNAFQSSAE